MLETLFCLARQPFLSQSVAVFIVMEAIAKKDWGLRKLASTAGLIDIIVNDVVDNKLLLDAKVISQYLWKVVNLLTFGNSNNLREH